MEKIPFSELVVEVHLDPMTIKYNDKNIEVKTYLPINKKLQMITEILEITAGNDYNFVNPVQLDLYTSLFIIKYYTNIEFTDEEWADPPTIYDKLEQNGIINRVVEIIPAQEYKFIIDGVQETVDSYYRYKNSALGILETISQDYSQLNMNAEDLQKKIGDPDNLNLLKDVLTKLG